MSHQIHKAGVRKALHSRREPYWTRIAEGLYLGYRKIAAERGSWVARLRDPDTGKQVYHALGGETDTFGFDAAAAAATKWTKQREQGVRDEPITVKQACEQYVTDREREKGKATSQDAKKRFDRTVYDAPLGAVQLARIKVTQIKAWRDGLGLSKGSANRTLTALKAALNLAVTNRLVSAEVAREWGDVKPYKDADGRRTLFLDLAQRRALLDAATGSTRDLIEGVMLTGARAGELTNAKRSQFDARTGTMEFVGKTGKRVVPLAPAAVTLFKKLAKSKLPTAWLFTRADGQPWAHSDWDQLVRAAAKVAKLPEGTCLYSLRHSFVTACITDGMSTMDVAHFVGTSLAMIQRHYGQFVQSAARERLAKIVMV